MRRFLTLVCLLCLAVPAGITISSCSRNPGANYCNGLGYGMKITDVDTITLQPATTGISLAFGQTQQSSAPSALTCKGTAATAGAYTYGTTNNQLVDISPTGNICAGTWNRNSGGGIADFTICNKPSPLPSTGGLPYGIAYITASAQSVTSNPVEVFVHAMVTSVSLVTTPTSSTTQQCFSQGSQATLDAQACFVSNNTQYELCAPSSVTSGNYTCPGGQLPGSTVSNCTAAIGALSYLVGNPQVASVTTNTTTNQVTITALQPGSTAITSSVANSGSSAGYFSTCPPASISITLANGSTSGIITKGVTQNLTTTATDTYGNPLTGLTLIYQSTDPIDIAASSSGAISTAYPGVASIYAVCQPPTCNPSPINETGIYGTGLPVSSNPVTVTTPGTASDYVWFAAPGQSEYVVPVELLTGTVGSTVRLPYVPNSMMMDRGGTNLFFGSSHELMIMSTANNSVATKTSVPGVVLAVSPNGQTVLINDQVRQLFYIYPVLGGTSSTFGGMGTAAAWTPDSDTLYIVDSASQGAPHSDKLYVYNASTGWATYDLSTTTGGSKSLAITIPSVGAFLGGSSTVAHTWCPSGTVGNYANMLFYPQGPSPDNLVAAQTDVLAATTDGQHILGASTSGSSITLSDIGVNIPTLNCLPTDMNTNPLALGDTLSPLVLLTALTQPSAITTPTADFNSCASSSWSVSTCLDVVPSPASNLAFITYTPPTSGANTGVSLPYYVPGACVAGTGGAPPTCTTGTVGSVTLTGNSAITAPLAGAFTPDDKLFFVSTAGDNMIHYISVPTLTDTQQISPNLPACTPGTDSGCTYSGSNTVVPATAIAVKPRPTT